MKGYRLWCPDLKKVIISRDVTFNENALLHSGKEAASSSSSHAGDDLESTTEKTEFEFQAPNTGQKNVSPSTSISPSQLPTMLDPDDVDYSIARDRLRREVKQPKRYSEADLVVYALTVAKETDEGREPQTSLKLFLVLILPNGLLQCMKKLNLFTKMKLGSW